MQTLIIYREQIKTRDLLCIGRKYLLHRYRYYYKIRGSICIYCPLVRARCSLSTLIAKESAPEPVTALGALS